MAQEDRFSSSLVLIDEFTISSATAAVTLGAGSNGSSGANVSIDTTYDVYKIVATNVKVNTDDALAIRITKGGSVQDDSNYDDAKKYLKSDTSYSNIGNEDLTQVDFTATIDSGVSASAGNGIGYLFNFPNADEYSFVTIESSHFQYNDNAGRGFYGCFIHTVASASDGVTFKTNGGNNLTAGHFALYGLKK